MKRMEQRHAFYVLFLLALMLLPFKAEAQISGVITDSLTHEPLMYINVQYEGKSVGAVSNVDGEYKIQARRGWDELTFSAIGYITKKVKLKPGTTRLDVQLAPDNVMLAEVVVKPKKERYSRKNNPAVEFMRKVIAHKKGLKLEEKDYYQYRKYEKNAALDCLNDVTPRKDGEGHLQEVFLLQGTRWRLPRRRASSSCLCRYARRASRTYLPQKPRKQENHHRRRELKRH